MELSFQQYILDFKFDAGTSRGVLKQKSTYIIKIFSTSDQTTYGLGEAGPLKGLSVDGDANLIEKLEEVRNQLKGIVLPNQVSDIYKVAKDLAGHFYPSIRFALEVAMLDLFYGGRRVIFDSEFTNHKLQIPINGLVWMGHMEDMLLQISEKIDLGFDCIKMKVGSIDFEKECDILEYIRRKYYNKKIILRIDANGAFASGDALEKLERLSAFNIHSIEQPIKQGQLDEMAILCKKSPIPIALDEELIGINEIGKKRELLEKIRPPYIILKPTLLGGIKATQEWIDLAESLKIGWWITSALESNIGLNAITQYTASLDVKNHQGLGTGSLYHSNFDSPLEIKKGYIRYNHSGWDLSKLHI